MVPLVETVNGGIGDVLILVVTVVDVVVVTNKTNGVTIYAVETTRFAPN